MHPKLKAKEWLTLIFIVSFLFSLFLISKLTTC